MQFDIWLGGDIDIAVFAAWVTAYFEEMGLPTELTEGTYRLTFCCPRLALSFDNDPEDAAFRNEQAGSLLRDWGVTVSDTTAIDGQLYASCDNAAFAKMIQYLLDKTDADFFLGSEFWEWILYRRNGELFVHDEWKMYFYAV